MPQPVWFASGGARIWRAALVTVAAASLGLASCTSDGDDAEPRVVPAERGTTTTAGGTEPGPEPTPVSYEEVTPGGDCRCGDGSEYRFWVHEGDPSKVAFYLQGGGACFDEESCSFTDGEFKVQVTDDDEPGDAAGLLALGDDRNPLAGWSVVFVPYCTGDVHLGTAEHTYGADHTVAHVGFTNGSAALDELVARFGDAEQVLVTGESAGAAATPLYAGLISDRLPDARISVLADGAGGYPDVAAVNGLIGGIWGTPGAIPDWPETEGVSVQDWGLPSLYSYVGAHDPDIRFARRDFAHDEAQEFYSSLAGLGDDVLGQVNANEAAIEATGVPMGAYVSPGDDHTILTTEDLWDHEVSGVSLLDWIRTVLGAEAIPDVYCETCRPS